MTQTLSVRDALQLGIQHYEAGDLQKAEAVYNQVLRVQPDNPDALNFLGVLAHRVGKYEIAEQLISKSLSIAPDNVCACFHFGRVLQSLRKYDEALSSYKRTLSLDASYVDALINMGGIYDSMDNYAKAIECYHKALVLSPGHAGVLSNLGNAHFKCNDYDKALSFYENALAINPQMVSAYLGVGNVLCYQGKLNEALKNCRQAVSLAPGIVETHIALGNVYERAKLYDKAVEAYKRALEIEPGNAKILSNIGFALTSKGDAAAAFDYLKKAKDMAPSIAGIDCNLANVLTALGKIDEALVHYKMAVTNYIEQHKTRPDVKPRKRSLPNTVAKEAFLDFYALMERNSFEFFLCFGTLLGCVREGNFLSFDKDIDLGLTEDVPLDKLFEVLRASDKFTIDETRQIREKPMLFSLNHENGADLDIFIHRKSEGKLLVGIDHPGEDFYWQFSQFKLAKKEFLGKEVLVPEDCDLYLSEIYGDWKTPDPFFDSLVSGKNIVHKASKLSLCYALNRIYDNTSKGDYEKALAFCVKAEQVFPEESVIGDVKRFLQ